MGIPESNPSCLGAVHTSAKSATSVGQMENPLFAKKSKSEDPINSHKEYVTGHYIQQDKLLLSGKQIRIDTEQPRKGSKEVKHKDSEDNVSLRRTVSAVQRTALPSFCPRLNFQVTQILPGSRTMEPAVVF